MSKSLSNQGFRHRVLDRLDTSGGPDACHLWPGWVHEQGYGLVERYGRKHFVHRLVLSWALESERGQGLTEDEDALHSCDNPPCANRRHLHPGTHADNMREASERGRMRPPRGGASPRAKLTDEQVADIRARLATGVRQQVLADEYGVRQTTISNIKLHRRYP